MIYFLFVERKPVIGAFFVAVLILSESRSLTVFASLFAIFWFMISNVSLIRKLFIVIAILIITAVSLYLFVSREDILFKIGGTLYGDLLYIRAAMVAGGVQLAAAFFPFGAGGGTFGSSLSVGSEAYVMVGIAHWDTVVDMTGVFDSGLGSILGEYGYFGLIIYIILLIVGFRSFGAKKLPYAAVFFLTIMVLYMNLFWTIASDFFFSFFILFLFMIVSQKYSSKLT